MQRFRENRAARKIQHEWLDYRHRQHDEDVDDVSNNLVGYPNVMCHE